MASPSLHGVPRVVPPLQRYYGTLRLPAVRLDPFARADTIVSPVVCSPRSWASHRGPRSCRFRSPIRIYDGNVGVSQVPWKPWWSLSVLFDPGRIRQAEWTMSELPDTAPPCVQNEGSKRLVFSGLNHTTFDLAVYFGRVYNNVTGLKKSLRQYLRANNHSLVACDVANSQPLLVGLLCRHMKQGYSSINLSNLDAINPV